MSAVIGVLGGMGPLATADFFRKVILATPAQADEDHVPLLIASDPRIPHRPAAILEGGPSPLPALLALRDRLLCAGARALVMPCNTAHHWHAELARNAGVPFPSIVEVSCDAARQRLEGAQVGLIATRATLAAHLFQGALAARGLSALVPEDSSLDQQVLPSIAAVKAGRLAEALPLMRQAVQALLDRGASSVLLACTEAPIALEGAEESLRARTVDTTAALAEATVRLWMRLRRDQAAARHA